MSQVTGVSYFYMCLISGPMSMTAGEVATIDQFFALNTCHTERTSDTAPSHTGQSRLQTLRHGFSALEVILESPKAESSARELAERLGLRERSCYYLLEALCEQGYVVRFVGGRYGIGPKLERLNHRFSGSVLPDSRVLDPFARLAEQLDLPVSLNGWYGSEIIVQRAFPDRFGRATVGVGYRDQLTSRCSTKAILAFVSEKRLLRYFASHRHPATTERTITDFEPFRNHLLELAERGYALDLAETRSDLCGVAAPFFTSLGFPIGSFGVPVPVELFDSKRESIIEVAMDTALEASRALGYSGAYPPPSPLQQRRSG